MKPYFCTIAFILALGSGYSQTWAQGGFIESFTGRGRHSSTDGAMGGLDNDAWSYQTIGIYETTPPVVIDNGWQLDLIPNEDEGYPVRSAQLSRLSDSTGSVRFRVDIDDFFMRTPFDTIDSGSQLSLCFRIDDGQNGLCANIAALGGFIFDGGTVEFDKRLTISMDGVSTKVTPPVIGANIRLEFEVDASRDYAYLTFDANRDDSVEGETISRSFSGGSHINSMYLYGFGGYSGGVNGVVREISQVSRGGRDGDFDGDGILGIRDVEMIQQRVKDESTDTLFNLIAGAAVDADDLGFWVHNLRRTYFGDADVDGEFNSSDLINVFQAGEYEDDIVGNSTWSTGDWNADGEFTTSDLVVAFQDGGYEQGLRAGVSPVPEPNTVILLLLGACGYLWRRTDR